jgi:hypothetical protein
MQKYSLVSVALESLAGCGYDAWQRAVALLIAVAMPGLRQQDDRLDESI